MTTLAALPGVPKKVHKFKIKTLSSVIRSINKVDVLNLDFDSYFVKIGQKFTELWLSENRITERAETRLMKY